MEVFIFRLIYFTLIVDDFGVKFVKVENIEYLKTELKEYYVVEVDYAGSKYCGITLDWNNDNEL